MSPRHESQLAARAAPASRKAEVVLAYADDWQGLYVDGILQGQFHRARIEDVVETIAHLGNRPWRFSRRQVEVEWLFYRGILPTSIDDVEWESEEEPRVIDTDELS